MRRWFLLPLLLAILVLGCEGQGDTVPQQEEPASPALLAQMQESLSSYWDTAKVAAQGLYEKTYLPTMDTMLRDMYSHTSAAVSTYTGIFTDQLLTMLKGE